MEKANNKIEIIFFSPNALALIEGKNEGFGGAELDFWNLAQELQKDPRINAKFAVMSKSEKKIRVNNVQLITVREYESSKPRRGNFIGYTLRLAKTLFFERVDYYFLGLPSYETIVAFFVAKIRRKQIIYRIEHDWETNKRDLYDKIFNGKHLLASVFIYFLKRSDYIIAQTNWQKNTLKQDFNLNALVINNGHIIPHEKKEIRQSILWIGRIHPVKHPDLFLELAKQIPNQEFVMIGSASKDYTKLFEDISSKADMISNLIFLGGVPYDQIDKFYKTSKIFVLTSEAEGQPNVLVEAMKFGVPVFSFSFNPDGILNGQFGFSANGNKEILIDKINETLNNPAKLEEYSKSAYTFAKENFDIEKICVVYKNLIFKKL